MTQSKIYTRFVISCRICCCLSCSLRPNRDLSKYPKVFLSTVYQHSSPKHANHYPNLLEGCPLPDLTQQQIAYTTSSLILFLDIYKKKEGITPPPYMLHIHCIHQTYKHRKVPLLCMLGMSLLHLQEVE